MKILYIHNEYGKTSGEENASKEIVDLLKSHGHEVRWFKRSSEEVYFNFRGHIKAFFTGIYNPSTPRKLAKVLDEYQPDIVQIQNIYPLLSVSLFRPLLQRNIPTVMRCPNYRLFCPTGLCIDNKGLVCEKCFGKGKETWCIRKNCLNNIFKSISYALRNCYARKSRKILDGVDIFIVQSEFQKQKFISRGISEKHIEILPGISPNIEVAQEDTLGEWVSFIGRVSSEKGIYEFLEAAKSLPEIPFKVAGNLDINFIKPALLPSNLEFVGFKKGDELNRFFSRSRIIVVPSKWYEGFPNVILRAMILKRPVISTRIGAMLSIIDDHENGLLVQPGNVAELSLAIKNLYPDIQRCKEMGESGHLKAESEYSRDEVYNKLIRIYQKAIKFNEQ